MKKSDLGASQVIVVVLLVMICIALGIIFFSSQKKLVSKVIIEEGGTLSCMDVYYDIGDLCYENVVQGSEDGIIIRFTARNNAEIVLYDFISNVGYGKNSKSVSASNPSEIKRGERKTYSSEFMEFSEDIDYIKIIPKVKIEDNIYICENKDTIIEEINLC